MVLSLDEELSPSPSPSPEENRVATAVTRAVKRGIHSYWLARISMLVDV